MYAGHIYYNLLKITYAITSHFLMLVIT